METVMTANYPVLPIAVAGLTRGFTGLAATLARWSKAFARALRNRREAHVLANLDRHMLADIGITRADVNDAFSAPFWEDPTELLAERAGDRRRYRTSAAPPRPPAVEVGFRRPPTNRPARQTM
jgi:uncharacterized protein YjiS (DUF1127 family)